MGDRRRPCIHRRLAHAPVAHCPYTHAPVAHCTSLVWSAIACLITTYCISSSPIVDAPPQAGRPIGRGLVNHSVTTRSSTRRPGRTRGARTSSRTASDHVMPPCDHLPSCGAVHIAHCGPQGPQARSSHPSPPIHPALVGGGRPVCGVPHATCMHRHNLAVYGADCSAPHMTPDTCTHTYTYT